ncbi:PDZ domain-containing protein [bacterium]|nr:MAG: PDZ domain-containing protein [bacterium]
MIRKFFALFALTLLLPVLAAWAQDNPRETPVVRAVKKAVPSVVGISAEIETGGSPFTGIDPFFDRFFRDFFGDFPAERGRSEASLGSGVLIDNKGHILTNEHVIHGATKITVNFTGGESAPATLVGADSATDLAVLRVEPKKWMRPVELGRSSDLMIGETVIAIGNPFGLAHTVTTGVVSAVGRTVQGGDKRTYTDFIQTDASINPGNSGGPLLNIMGDLVGINAAIYQSAEGIGFAIPVDKAKRIYSDLINYGEVHRAWLGVQVQEVDDSLADYFKMKSPYGVVVKRVFEDGPAQQAGIRSGDVILAIDGKKIEGRGDYSGRLAGYTAESDMALSVLTKGSERVVMVHTRQMPEEFAKNLARTWLGIKAVKNTDRLVDRFGLATKKGMVILEVSKKSTAEEAGFEPGDVIHSINDTPVEDEEAFREAILSASLRETVVMVIQRGRRGYHVTLNP